MYLQKQSTNNTFRTKSFACKTLARPRYCAAINSISAVCASSRSVFYVIGNCIAISYYIKKETGLHYVAMPPVYLTGGIANMLHCFFFILIYFPSSPECLLAILFPSYAFSTKATKLQSKWLSYTLMPA